MKKIGIFAGTFDPVHTGHLAFAQAALDAGLEKVWFVVEPRPRRKQGVRALEHRQAMVELAIADEPRFGSIVVEQARFTPNETLPPLMARFKGYKLVLLFGDDVLGHIAHWPHIQSLARSVDLMIATRRHDQAELEERMQAIESNRQLHFNYGFVHPDKPAISSSRLRLVLKKRHATRSIPKSVQDYIAAHRLYFSATRS